jgi:hypothetical protein
MAAGRNCERQYKAPLWKVVIGTRGQQRQCEMRQDKTVRATGFARS